MSYNLKPQLRDSYGEIIPQYYDSATDEYKVLTNKEYLQKISGEQLETDKSISFANSAPANTENIIVFFKPSILLSEYEIIVHNPSTITDLTIKIYNIQQNLGGTDRDSYINAIAIPKARTTSVFVKGMFNGTDSKLIIMNDTLLGVGDGFTSTIRIRETR